MKGRKQSTAWTLKSFKNKNPHTNTQPEQEKWRSTLKFWVLLLYIKYLTQDFNILICNE